jgi:cytochrome c
MRRSVLSDSLGGMAMIRVFIAASFAALILFFAPAAVAAEIGTKEEAVAMVKRVQERFKKDGAEATFKAVSDKSTPEFHDRDLYPFIYDMKGLNVAHGARPALIGKNLIDFKDPDGKYIFHEMIKVADGPGSGWIDYKFLNPFTNKVENKSSYVEKIGDYYVGVGIYKP